MRGREKSRHEIIRRNKSVMRGEEPHDRCTVGSVLKREEEKDEEVETKKTQA